MIFFLQATKKLESFGKVFAIAFTDSVHFMSRDRRLDAIYSWFVEVRFIQSRKIILWYKKGCVVKIKAGL